MTNDNRKLIDKLVHSESKIEIIDILKKLVPEATEFTLNLYAYHTEFCEDSLWDKFMDIESDAERKTFWQENFSDSDKEFFKDALNLIPHIPLTADERLYKIRRLTSTAPKPENKYLKDYEYTTPLEKYIVQAMVHNHELDRASAEKFVLAEIEKISAKNSQPAPEKISEPEPTPMWLENFLLMCWTETSYIKHINFFTKKSNPDMSEEEVIDSGYGYFLETVKSIVDPNYIVRSDIAVDAHFQTLVEDMKNELERNSARGSQT
ncbi:MAG: hypothetical protein IJS81_01525 [Selenomonadaceae bacterium]|nr:hypothetical protein [Selenomonadaceae bacterium]